MNKIRPVLGRGLDALIAPNLQNNLDTLTVPSNEIKTDDGISNDLLAKIPVKLITPNPYQPRTVFNPEAIEDLKKSILAHGLIQPITVRRLSPQNYELISGERRLRACRDIGYKDIPAYIIKVDTKEAMLALALIENIQREKLNAIEVAEAYKRLMDECSLSQEEIAEQVGKDRTTITNSIRLLKLPKQIQESLIKDEISSGHARALINLPSETIQMQVLQKILSDNLSVRKVENLVKKIVADGEIEHKTPVDLRAKKIENLSQKDLEDKLRRLLGTKVSCKQRQDGKGEIVIEFYSSDELERLLEMLEIAGKAYN